MPAPAVLSSCPLATGLVKRISAPHLSLARHAFASASGRRSGLLPPPAGRRSCPSRKPRSLDCMLKDFLVLNNLYPLESTGFMISSMASLYIAGFPCILGDPLVCYRVPLCIQNPASGREAASRSASPSGPSASPRRWEPWRDGPDGRSSAPGEPGAPRKPQDSDGKSGVHGKGAQFEQVLFLDSRALLHTLALILFGCHNLETTVKPQFPNLTLSGGPFKTSQRLAVASDRGGVRFEVRGVRAATARGSASLSGRRCAGSGPAAPGGPGPAAPAVPGLLPVGGTWPIGEPRGVASQTRVARVLQYTVFCSECNIA